MKTNNEEIVRQRLDEFKKLDRKRDTIPPPAGIDFISNDYLGLRQHPSVIQAACEAISKHGIGAGASRLLGGNHDLFHALEIRLAEFKGTERALVFPSGFATNTGVIPALAKKGDAVWSDELNHASIIDGCRISGGAKFVYPHCDIKELDRSLTMHRKSFGFALIVTEGVFSMDGDICPLPELVELARKHDATLMVDEAHSTGVLGNSGAGVFEHYGVPIGHHIIMGTLSKALGSQGGFVCSRKDIAEYLINCCRSFIYSTGLALPCVAAAIAATEVLCRQPELLGRLWENRAIAKSAFRATGLHKQSNSQIFPIIIGHESETIRVASALRDKGYYVGAVRPPSVPQGESRLRVTVSAMRTRNEIEGLARELSAMLNTNSQNNDEVVR